MRPDTSTVIISIQLLQLMCFHSFSDAKNVESKIRVRLYNESNQNFYEVPIRQGYTLFSTTVGYNRSLPMVLIVHGMAMGADSYFVSGMVNALVGKQLNKKYNILAVDMPELFQNNLFNNFYFGVLSNVQPSGKRIGEFLNEVIELNMTKPEDINMIGYSIGAQVAGYAARTVKEVFGKINYIAGLDPAGPGFHNLFGRVSGLTHVSQADARTAHFLHTNSVSCGTRDRVGTADFVFNSGALQPGCFVDSPLNCSHVRVPHLYMEAVTNPENFVARRCSSWAYFRQCQCNQHETIPLTFPPDESAHGIYYLRTRSKSPFGLGFAGTHCRKITRPTDSTEYHQGPEVSSAHNYSISDSKNLLNTKIKNILKPQDSGQLQEDFNIHIMNSIKRIEDFHTPGDGDGGVQDPSDVTEDPEDDTDK